MSIDDQRRVPGPIRASAGFYSLDRTTVLSWLTALRMHARAAGITTVLARSCPAHAPGLHMMPVRKAPGLPARGSGDCQWPGRQATKPTRGLTVTEQRHLPVSHLTRATGTGTSSADRDQGRFNHQRRLVRAPGNLPTCKCMTLARHMLSRRSARRHVHCPGADGQTRG